MSGPRRPARWCPFTAARRPNPGWFKPGPDSRRHRFTTQDCRIGYWVTMMGLTPRTRSERVREWVRKKVCVHNAAKDRAREASAAAASR